MASYLSYVLYILGFVFIAVTGIRFAAPRGAIPDKLGSALVYITLVMGPGLFGVVLILLALALGGH